MIRIITVDVCRLNCFFRVEIFFLKKLKLSYQKKLKKYKILIIYDKKNSPKHGLKSLVSGQHKEIKGEKKCFIQL